MSRQLSEKQVLEMLGIPDFRHLSKDRIMSFTSALPQMEPQVAIAALQQVPHFADTSLEIMQIYKETVSQTLAEDQENVQSFNASCDMVLGLLETLSQNDDLSFEQKNELIDRMMAVLKMKFGASELITTIMLNYIALEFVSYCVTNPPFKDMTPGAAPRMPSVVDAVKLPIILPQTRLHFGIILALLAVVVYYIFMWKTTRGYEMRVIGMNPNAGRYSGMNIPVNSLLSMFIAGGFAGLGGTINIIGLQYFLTEGFSNNFGFSGVAVALLGGCHPLGIIVSGILFGALNAGGVKMQLLAKVPSASIYMIQGMIIIFAVSRELFIWFGRTGKSLIPGKSHNATGGTSNG